MSFDTPIFLGFFLPGLLIPYLLIPNRRFRKGLLIAASLLFCAFGSLSGAAVLLVSAAINYGIGKKVSGRKAFLVLGILWNLGLLIVFKYLAFFLGELFRLPGAQQMLSGLIAPLGISFFTFKSLSYLIDTYRGAEIQAYTFPDFLLYVSFFPQLSAGPISRFPDFRHQLDDFHPEMGAFALGLRRLIVGMGKKLLIAYPLSQAVDAVFSAASPSAPLAWLGAIAYLLQIFFDFSAYSDMAIGLGQLFGFQSPENFNAPYLAVSITDFWRRWHLSLSHWFRDYLYIPLGGSRRGKARATLNKLIVFTLCGFWHGAAWSFLLWGIWHGLFAALETLGCIRPAKSGWKQILSRGYTLLVVCIGFVLFRSSSLSQACTILGAMLGAGTASLGNTVLLRSLLTPRLIAVLAAAAALSCLAPGQFRTLEAKHTWLTPLSYGAVLILLVLSLAAMAANGFQPFIYARF